MSDRGYIVFSIRFRSSSHHDAYTLTYTHSDPYDDERVKSNDRTLHKTLSEIFRERRLTSRQIKELIRAPEKRTNKKSIFQLILERSPALGKLLLKRNKLSLLWIAVLSCYQDSAELLVRSGADVNEIYGSEISWPKLTKQTSLLHALLRMYPSSWNEQFIGLLIDHGADFRAQGSFGSTVLESAIRNGRVKVVETLLEKGVDVNAVGCADIPPLLVAASSRNADELVPLFMSHGADVIAKDACGWNVLCYLARAPGEEHTDLARVLIDKGVSPRETDPYNSEPIHEAIVNGKIELVNLFLDHGANVNSRASLDKGLLHIAAQYCENPAVLRTLLKRGVDIDHINMHGETALHALVKRQSSHRSERNRLVEKLKILLSVGADMFAEASNGCTPFDNMWHYNMEYARIFLKTLALRKASLQPSSIILEGERIVEHYTPLWNRYKRCIEVVNKMKTERFTKSCTFFELMTKCQCQIAALMRNREFERKFRLYDLKVFSSYGEDILEAFERAKHCYHSVLEQEEVINEAVYNILPYMVVRKVVHYMKNCEICEIKKIVQASRVPLE